MPRLSYVNERPDESVVVITPWAYATKVSPGGRIDIRFEIRGIEKPEILVTHRASGEIEIGLSVDLVAISGDGVANLVTRPDAPPR